MMMTYVVRVKNQLQIKDYFYAITIYHLHLNKMANPKNLFANKKKHKLKISKSTFSSAMLAHNSAAAPTHNAKTKWQICTLNHRYVWLIDLVTYDFLLL